MKKLLLVLMMFFLCRSVHAYDVTLAWDSNTEESIAGYRIYQANESRTQVLGSEANSISGNILHVLWTDTQQFTLVGVIGTRYWVATAYNMEGYESGPSNEVSYIVEPLPPDTTPPGQVQGVLIASIDISEPQTGRIRLEAEDGAISSPMEIGQDFSAYNGAFVWSQTGGHINDPDQSSSYVDLAFDVVAEGYYVLWARVVAPSGSDDSFWFRMDEGNWKQWHTVRCTSWTWDRMDHRDNSYSPEQEVIYYLSLGSHILRITQREDGTKVDSVLITTDLAYAPE